MKRHNDYRLSELLQKFRQQPQLESRIVGEKVKEFWATELGEYIPRQTKTITVNHHKLYIRIDSSVLKEELRFKQEELISRINLFLGEDYIQDIIFH